HVQDRRRGLHREGTGRAAELAELRTVADIGVRTMTSRVVATRGERLTLVRTVYAGRDQRPDAFHTEILRIAEIDTDGRIAAYIGFDLDDFDAAFDELDARYVAGEAAAHARTWSVVASAYASLNSGKLPATSADWVIVDHRRGLAYASDDSDALVRTAWAVTPDFS